MISSAHSWLVTFKLCIYIGHVTFKIQNCVIIYVSLSISVLMHEGIVLEITKEDAIGKWSITAMYIM